jgi:hypothetical protein
MTIYVFVNTPGLGWGFMVDFLDLTLELSVLKKF